MSATQDTTLHPLLATLVARLEEAGDTDALVRAATHVRRWRAKGGDDGERLGMSAEQMVEQAVFSLDGQAHGDLYVGADLAERLTAQAEHRLAIAEGLQDPLGASNISVRTRAVEMAEKALGVKGEPGKLREMLAEGTTVDKVIVEAFGRRKKRMSKSRALAASLMPCPNCNSVRLPHANCPNCGSAPLISTEEQRDAAQQIDASGQTDVIQTSDDASTPKLPLLEAATAEGAVIAKGAGLTGKPDEVVRALQQRLSEIGHGVDQHGKFDMPTEQAVLAFQEKMGLDPTGKVDAMTVLKLRDPKPLAHVKEGEGAAAAEEKPEEKKTDGVMTPKDLGTELKKHGYDPKDPVGSLKKIQRLYGLDPTGTLDTKTQKLLRRLGGSAATEDPEEGKTVKKDKIQEASYSSGGFDSDSPVARDSGGIQGLAARRPAPATGDPANRTPGMDDFFGQEPVKSPPNLHEAPDLTFPRCSTCVHHDGVRLCALYSAGTDKDDICDSWFTLTPGQAQDSAMFYARVNADMYEAQEDGDGSKIAVLAPQARAALLKVEESIDESSPEFRIRLRALVKAQTPLRVAEGVLRADMAKEAISRAERGMPGVTLQEASGGEPQVVCMECATVQGVSLVECVECGHPLPHRALNESALDDAADALSKWRLDESALSAEARKKLPKSSFAIPEKEAYPIHDESHARNALARVAQHGTPDEKKRVRAAVKKKYPGVIQEALALVEVHSSAYPKLERVPGKQNWVDYAGGLPDYIERIAKHIHYEGGKPIGTAIAEAVGTVRRWCAGGGASRSGASKANVKTDTKAKACAAVAEWEAKKKSGGAAQKAAGKLREAALDPGVLAVLQAIQEAEMLDIEPAVPTPEEALATMAAVELHESTYPTTLHFDPRLHPRDRAGEFREILGRLAKNGRGAEVTLPHGVTVHTRAGGRLIVRQSGRKIGTFHKPEEAAASAITATGIPERTQTHHFGVQSARYNVAFHPGEGKNPEVVSSALSGDLTPRRGKNLTTVPGEQPNTSTVLSYDEPLAHIDHNARTVHLNMHKYSPTTSSHRTMVRAEAEKRGYAVHEIDRAESRSRAGMDPNVTFEKLPAGVKRDADTEKSTEWKQAGEGPGQDRFTWHRTTTAGKREMLTQTPSGYTHVTMNKSGSIQKIRELNAEEGKSVLGGRSTATLDAQRVAQDRSRRIHNETMDKASAKEKGRLVAGSSGSFLTPPGHPDQRYSVETDLRRKKENRSQMSLSHAVNEESLDTATRSAAAAKMREYEQAKPPLEHPAVQEWVRSTLGYYANMHHDPSDKSGMSVQKLDPMEHADTHMGVRMVRRYYPNYQPKPEDFAPGGYGQKAETKWHHDVETTSALENKVMNSDLVRMTDKPSVTIHRIKGEGLWRNATHVVREGDRQKIAYSAKQAVEWARDPQGMQFDKGASMNHRTGEHFFNGSPTTNRPTDKFEYTGGEEKGDTGINFDPARLGKDAADSHELLHQHGYAEAASGKPRSSQNHWYGRGYSKYLDEQMHAGEARARLSEPEKWSHLPPTAPVSRAMADLAGEKHDTGRDETALRPGETWPQHRRRMAKLHHDAGSPPARIGRPREVKIEGSAEAFKTIEVGDRITIRTPHGSEQSGRAVMHGPHGWVANAGGRHGTPIIAHEGNVLKVRKAKKLSESAAEIVAAVPTLRSDPNVASLLRAEEATLVRLPLAQVIVAHGKKLPSALVEELREMLVDATPVEEQETKLQEATEAGDRNKVTLYETLLKASRPAR